MAQGGMHLQVIARLPVVELDIKEPVVRFGDGLHLDTVRADQGFKGGDRRSGKKKNEAKRRPVTRVRRREQKREAKAEGG
eukprot:4858999-Pleurochrysis_carterae.AAC.1